MQEIDRAFTEWPFFGVRQMRNYLRLQGYGAGIKRVRRLMRLMELMPIYQKPRTSIPHPEHKRYPYLLSGLSITRPNQVWCTDITYGNTDLILPKYCQSKKIVLNIFISWR
jgi:putative transposase